MVSASLREAYRTMQYTNIMQPFFVYILQCADNSYYTGHTDNIEKRLAEHLSPDIDNYVSDRLPVKLVYLQEFMTRDEAINAEHQVKKWSRKKKEALMSGDWDTLKAHSKKKFKK